MEIRQSVISKIEHQDDILVKTLERYIKALGGELEIRVDILPIVETRGLSLALQVNALIR